MQARDGAPQGFGRCYSERNLLDMHIDVIDRRKVLETPTHEMFILVLLMTLFHECTAFSRVTFLTLPYFIEKQ